MKPREANGVKRASEANGATDGERADGAKFKNMTEIIGTSFSRKRKIRRGK